jgi:predicted porin
MNKKIAAVAVAGLFAAPAVALAQSSVTISGNLKMSFENLKLNNFSSARIGAETNKSQYGVADDSSRIIFNIREDLGGGLSAIGQLDVRVKPDDTQGAGQPNGNLAQGNSHLGLQSKSWGRIFFGRQDLHYFNTSGNISGKNSLRADSISLLSYGGGGATAIAGTTRTQNVVHYTTPNWGGFTAIVAYSSNPTTTDGDMVAAGTTTGAGTLNDNRKGRAWNLNPNYAAANWQVGYSYWNSKPDGGTAVPGSTTGFATPLAALASINAGAASANQESHRLYGHYEFGFGLKVGFAWDKSKLKVENALPNVSGGNLLGISDGTVSSRVAWSIPFQYSFMGKHQITGHYTKAKDGTASFEEAFGNNGANMWALGYSYDLSKRTSLGITYARINNKEAGQYNFFTSGSLGLGQGGVLPGEDPRMFGTTIRHSF